MRAWQHACFGDDLAHGDEIATVNALAGVQNIAANDLAFQFLENFRHLGR